MTENFFHALWIDELNSKEVDKLHKYFKSIFKNYELEYKRDIYTVLFNNLPIFQFGIKKDNVIATIVGGQDDLKPNFKAPDTERKFKLLKRYTKNMNPDVFITGFHACYINCNRCCDTAPIEPGIERRYCEYLSEIGNYCLFILAEKERKDDVCDKWWCHELTYSITDHYDGPFGLRPLIFEMKSYDRSLREEFVKVFRMLKDGKDVDECVKVMRRGREVIMFKESINAINKILEECGKDTIISFSSLDELERELKIMNVLDKCKNYIEKLRSWERIVKDRKGI